LYETRRKRSESLKEKNRGPQTKETIRKKAKAHYKPVIANLAKQLQNV